MSVSTVYVRLLWHQKMVYTEWAVPSSEKSHSIAQFWFGVRISFITFMLNGSSNVVTAIKCSSVEVSRFEWITFCFGGIESLRFWRRVEGTSLFEIRNHGASREICAAASRTTRNFTTCIRWSQLPVSSIRWSQWKCWYFTFLFVQNIYYFFMNCYGYGYSLQQHTIWYFIPNSICSRLSSNLTVIFGWNSHECLNCNWLNVWVTASNLRRQ